jgi:hypothetical protein
MDNAYMDEEPEVVWHIRRAFEREFWPVRYKFDLIFLREDEIEGATHPSVSRSGVYIWTDGRKKVIKVGRSLSNSRKRAVEHLYDNTGGTMGALKDDPEALLVLINVEPQDKHWAAALELYMEQKLQPEISSKRQG